MNQAILFEHVPKNTTFLFDITSSGIHDFNPTSITKAAKFKDPIKQKNSFQEIPEIQNRFTFAPQWYLANFYLTGESYFDFLTCHGFHKAAPLTVYLQPFDIHIWVTMLSAIFCTVLALTLASTFYLGPALVDKTVQLRQTFSTFATLTCYSISVLVENGFGNIPKIYSLTGKSAFLILAFMSINL
jgi:hypothetical protein